MKCKHKFHFIKEIYLDEWSSISSFRKYQRGNYAKFVCEHCGLIKLVFEKGEE